MLALVKKEGRFFFHHHHTFLSHTSHLHEGRKLELGENDGKIIAVQAHFYDKRWQQSLALSISCAHFDRNDANQGFHIDFLVENVHV